MPTNTTTPVLAATAMIQIGSFLSSCGDGDEEPFGGEGGEKNGVGGTRVGDFKVMIAVGEVEGQV